MTSDARVWSGTDFPFACLMDKVRTEAFAEAISKSVKPGDVVLDLGAGTGILSFLAAKAGAGQVVAVEIDAHLSQSLRKAVRWNSLDKSIKIMECDAREVKMSKTVDVVLAELMETGLMDELMVPVLNKLRRRGVITAKTKIIPKKFRTYVQLVEIENDFYGFKIAAPMHFWPYYEDWKNGWWKIKSRNLSRPVEVHAVDFEAGIVPDRIDQTMTFQSRKGRINAVRFSSEIDLGSGDKLKATNALNGDKIIFLEPFAGGGEVKLRFRYVCGGGLQSLMIDDGRGNLLI